MLRPALLSDLTAQDFHPPLAPLATPAPVVGTPAESEASTRLEPAASETVAHPAAAAPKTDDAKSAALPELPDATVSAPKNTPIAGTADLRRYLTDSLVEDARREKGALTAADLRQILANPALATKDFALRLIRELKVHETLSGDPDLYYLKKDILKILRNAWSRESAACRAAIDARRKTGELSKKEAGALKTLGDESLRREYEPVIASFKDPGASAFALITMSTFVPYLVMDPVAKWMGAHFSQTLSFLPGVFAPGTSLPGGGTAISPAAFPDLTEVFQNPYLLGAYFVGNVVTTLAIAGLRDSFKFSPLLMGGLEFADKAGRGGIVSRGARAVKTFVAKSQPKDAPIGQTLVDHGIIGYENGLLKGDPAPAPKLVLAMRDTLSSSRFGFIKSIGEALPQTAEQWKLYKTDIMALNMPVVALFSGFLPVAAELTHHAADPAYVSLYEPIDIVTRTAMAIGAGILAWSIGCIGNTRIMNHHSNYSAPEAAANLATRDRQFYSIAAYFPIMAFLIPNFSMAWQQGVQVVSAATLLAGVSMAYTYWESGMKKRAAA